MKSVKLAVFLSLNLLSQVFAFAGDPAPFGRLMARLVLPGRNPALLQVLE